MARQRFAPWQRVALRSPYTHTALFGGVATGKSYTGAHFTIKMIREHSDLTGFIGANTYDQLTQATLRELVYWLSAYGFQYVIDKKPPAAWKAPVFKTNNNILTVWYRGKAVTIFTRVLSEGDPLRGLEFSWYWLDETRDTPEDTHNTVLARMRESEFTAGLITTTPNGKDWSYHRFVEGCDDSGVYGSLHVPTKESLKIGLITEAYYKTLLRSYSTLLARQELDAEHLNVTEGRAYYAAGDWNRTEVAPWGDAQPDRDRALIVGMAFNFNPAPMSWTFMQEGPADTEFSEHVHIFKELARVNMGTKEMTQLMASMFPGFHLRIYGDASGKNQTTSNAGDTDYIQVQEALNEAGVSYTLDIDPGNPRVRDRVENVNRLCRNAIGETLLTYNPLECPTLDKDLDNVQWKPSGKIDAGKDGLLTHASDSAGYPLFKIRPFGQSANAILTIASQASQVSRVER